MTINTQSNSVYTDFKGLSQLQYQAATDDPKALKKVGQHFEALFIQMMLKSMRDATPDDPYFSGKGEALYRDLFDKQISLSMAKKSQLGLAQLIANQLRHNVKHQIDARQQDVKPVASPQTIPGSVSGGETLSKSAANDTAYQNPASFVKDVWPLAQKAASKLNVDPKVLVAQAALETGWGKGIITHPDGRSSNNVFGVKADSTWQKETASVPTLEYRDGVAVKEQANFRSYASLDQAFQDYVGFLQNNPRYKDALTAAGDPQQFTSALQSAGYATDPRYADKIQGVLGSDTLASALADLKLGGQDPIG